MRFSDCLRRKSEYRLDIVEICSPVRMHINDGNDKFFEQTAFLSEVVSGPEIPIECAVLNRFGDVPGLDVRLSFQISERAAHFQNPIISLEPTDLAA